MSSSDGYSFSNLPTDKRQTIKRATTSASRNGPPATLQSPLLTSPLIIRRLDIQEQINRSIPVMLKSFNVPFMSLNDCHSEYYTLYNLVTKEL